MSSINLQRRPHATTRARRSPTIRIHKQPLHIIHELSGDEDEAVPRFCIAENEEQALRAPSPAFTMMTRAGSEGKTKMERRQASIVPIGRSSLDEERTTLQVPRRSQEAESPDSFNITFSDKPFDFPRPPLPTPSSAKYSTPSFPSSPTSSSSSYSSSSSSDSEESDCQEPTKTAIEPLRIIKRRRSLSTAVSRAPLPHSPSSIIVASLSSDEEDHHHSESDSDDIGFYASEFNKILTLSSPLPPNFPRPESMYVPAGGISTQLDPAFAQAMKKVKRSSLAPIRHSRPAPAPPAVIISPCPSPRPPPRHSVPTDFELDEEWEGEIIELVEDAQSASSPYPASFVPEDVDEDSFYACYGDEEVESLSNFVLPGVERVAEDLMEELAVFGAPSPLSSGFPASPFPTSPFPTSPVSPISSDSLCVPKPDARLVEPISAHSCQAEFFEVPFTQPSSPSASTSASQVDEDGDVDEERERALRSRWSSSTLSSMHSTTHQKHHSHSSFLLSPFKGYFAGRSAKQSSPPSTPPSKIRSASPSKARSTSPSKTRSTSPVKMFTREKKAPAPLVFVSPTSLPLPSTPSPTRPARPYAYRIEGESPVSAWSFPSTPGSSGSPSRRKPRTSESSSRSETSFMSGYSGRTGARSAASFRSERSVGSDESVISCGSVMSEGGLRRKPIPVEMFLRA